MGDNGGRRAEREHHAIGEEFAFGLELLGQAIEDEVEIQFAGDGDVETGHDPPELKRALMLADAISRTLFRLLDT